MKTTILALVGAGAVLFGSAVAADAAGRDRTWSDGWKQSVTNSPPAHSQAAPVIEGRNAASPSAPQIQGVEPYIARQIESNRRSR
jgi:hypothetical protein